MDPSAPRRLGPYVGGGLLLALFGVQAFVRGVRVPLLGWIDLSIHEFGHLAFLWAPRDVMLVMGNGTQFLLPLALAAVFLLRERDLLGFGVCLGWAATSAQDASVYIADAPLRALPLLGPESSHDWWQLLAGHGLLDAAGDIATVVWLVGLMLWVVAVFVVGTGPWRDHAVEALGWRGILVDPPPPPHRVDGPIEVTELFPSVTPTTGPADPRTLPAMSSSTVDAHLDAGGPSVAELLKALDPPGDDVAR